MAVRLGSNKWNFGEHPLKSEDLNDTFSFIDVMEGTTNFSYDSDGNISSITNGSYTIEFTYDSDGRISQVVYKKDGTAFKTITINYNADGTISSIEVS